MEMKIVWDDFLPYFSIFRNGNENQSLEKMIFFFNFKILYLYKLSLEETLSE